jgi:unsaturated chondroitin disaccharide hydrolase
MKPDTSQLRAAFDFAQKQVASLTDNHPDYFPMYTVNGRWQHNGESWTNWCEGFLGGMMWIFHARVGSTLWRVKAEHYSRLLEHRKTDLNVHDLGFLFWSTYKRWYDQTGDDALRQIVITAGQTMGLRFKEKGQYLRSFVADESLFIDIMMNVGIVFYAAQQTGDDNLLRKAHAHCQTTRRYLVRGDGSTAHEGIFDLETGEFLRQTTHQGWRGDSAWARGLAWALYGFGTAYQLTGESAYLGTAEACARFYIQHTPADGVPPNDYDDPRRPVLVDSSAAAIAACGLLNLFNLTKNNTYRDTAFNSLATLTRPEYLAAETPGWEGILKHGVYHQAKNLGLDESVMWGEYFFVQALDQALTLLEST